MLEFKYAFSLLNILFSLLFCTVRYTKKHLSVAAFVLQPTVSQQAFHNNQASTSSNLKTSSEHHTLKDDLQVSTPTSHITQQPKDSSISIALTNQLYTAITQGEIIETGAKSKTSDVETANYVVIMTDENDAELTTDNSTSLHSPNSNVLLKALQVCCCIVVYFV